MANNYCLRASWSYAPGDSSCIGVFAAILVIEILVAVGSLTVIMAVLWLWLRGWITGSTDFTTAAGETVGSNGVPVGMQESFDFSAAASAPKTRTFGDSGTEMSAASRTTRTGNVARKESQEQVDVKEEGKDNTKREKEGVDNEIVCRIGPEGVCYQSVSKK
eukprot:Em0006g229a